jgi:MFS family permease
VYFKFFSLKHTVSSDFFVPSGRPCYSSIANLFFIYWFQDEVGGCVSGDVATNLGAGSGSANSCVPEFTLLGHFISSSPRTALALTTTISTVCSFVLVLPGGWIADRFVEDRALVMLVGALLQTSAPLINAFMPTFTWVCFACIITGVLNGLTGSASKAILADCVPLDPHTGKPFAPARDYIMMSYSSVVPTLILPGILGVVFDSFSSPSLHRPCICARASCTSKSSAPRSQPRLRVRALALRRRLSTDHRWGRGCATPCCSDTARRHQMRTPDFYSKDNELIVDDAHVLL